MTIGQSIIYAGEEYVVMMVNRALGQVRLRPVRGGHDVVVKIEALGWL